MMNKGASGIKVVLNDLLPSDSRQENFPLKAFQENGKLVREDRPLPVGRYGSGQFADDVCLNYWLASHSPDAPNGIDDPA